MQHNDDTVAHVRVTVDTGDAAGRALIAPIGMSTPHQTFLSLSCDVGPTICAQEKDTGQSVLVVPGDAYEGASQISLDYTFAQGGPGYPDLIYAPRTTRFTTAAQALVSHAGDIVRECANKRAMINALVAHTAEAFTYGHPMERYYDGREDVPLLMGCGTTQGSCIDINMYLIAALRSVGIEAGYVAGPFYPAEKNGRCDDMHCWAVTRADGEVLEWDIAHHLKLGTRAIAPGLNPKPGWRAAVSHSMGWDIPALVVRALKLLSQPMWVDAQGGTSYAQLDISSSGALASSGDLVA